MATRAHDRMVWLLRWMTDRVKCPFEHLCAWEEDLVDAFLKAFPEALKSAKHYTFGSPSVPMLNAAAQRAKKAGYVTAGSLGNQECKYLKQRTWCRTWRLTSAGRKAA